MKSAHTGTLWRGNWGQRMSSVALLAAVLLVGCAGGPAQTRPSAVPPGYALIWSDEFSQNGLPDPARWNHDTGMNKQGWHNNEKQYNSGPRAENAAVRDGRLVITARLEERRDQPDWGGQRYSSARLLTAGKAAWTYGFFEIRAKLPCGRGTWPALWMLGQGDWPAAGELDILEFVGREPGRIFSTVHTTSGSGGKGAGAPTSLPRACTAFHNYQMHWTPQELRFGVDGRTHFVYRNAGQGQHQWPFDAPQFLIMNVAIGGDLGGDIDDKIFPVAMEVDYVRVYQRRP